jgi:hypothetical protein
MRPIDHLDVFMTLIGGNIIFIPNQTNTKQKQLVILNIDVSAKEKDVGNAQ